MVNRKPAAAFLVLAFGILGCSKTQDTAPETRIFGDPPSIGRVDLNAGTESVTCDVSQAIRGAFCIGGGGVPDYYAFSPGPTVNIVVGYTEFEFFVQATDAQSTATQSDILLVTASFQTPVGGGSQIEETSLILLDDGQTLQFPWQQTQQPLDVCTFDPFNIPECTCNPGQYSLTTNDVAAADNVFTRGFAFLAPGQGIPANAFGMIESCVAREKHQAPFSAPQYIGTTLDFKVEAIDRAGNDTVWPVSLSGQVNPTSYSCTGDLCACCWVTASDPSACRGLPGMIALPGNQLWPEGTSICDYF